MQDKLSEIYDNLFKMIGSMDTHIRDLTERVSRIEALLERTVNVDDKRLDKHSAEIDELRKNITEIKTWKTEREQRRHIDYIKLTIAATLLAGILAVLMDKFL